MCVTSLIKSYARGLQIQARCFEKKKQDLNLKEEFVFLLMYMNMTKQQQKAIPITAFVYILTETMYMLLNITEIEKRLVSKVCIC